MIIKKKGTKNVSAKLRYSTFISPVRTGYFEPAIRMAMLNDELGSILHKAIPLFSALRLLSSSPAPTDSGSIYVRVSLKYPLPDPYELTRAV